MSLTLLLAGIVLIIMIVGIAAVAAWYFLRTPGQSASADVKTQRIVQRFVSRDLKKRAFVVQRGDGRFRVVFQDYSDKIVNGRRGDEEGWVSQSSKPLATSLAEAVKIAEDWTHQED